MQRNFVSIFGGCSSIETKSGNSLFRLLPAPESRLGQSGGVSRLVQSFDPLNYGSGLASHIHHANNTVVPGCSHGLVVKQSE